MYIIPIHTNMYIIPLLQGRVAKKKEVLEVRIERGMEHGKKIVFAEKADEMPGAITGDVILVVQQAEHKMFKREGNHLTMERDITLKDALCG
jgi:DnaJ-class molecular chaperone